MDSDIRIYDEKNAEQEELQDPEKEPQHVQSNRTTASVSPLAKPSKRMTPVPVVPAEPLMYPVLLGYASGELHGKHV